MDQKEFLESYGNVEDYFYNSDPDYYDLYDDEFNSQYNTNGDINGETSFWKNLSLNDLCKQCVLPVAWSAINLLAINVVLCIFFIVCNKFKIFTEPVLHIMCAVCGVLPIIYHEKNALVRTITAGFVSSSILLYNVCVMYVVFETTFSHCVFDNNSFGIILSRMLFECCLVANYKECTYVNVDESHVDTV